MVDGAHLLNSFPRAFFQPLASPGAALYASTLLSLFRDTQSQGGLIGRSRVVDHVLNALSQGSGLEDTAHLEDEEVHAGWSEEDDESGRKQARAGAIVRYLERCGWLRTEMQSDFRQMYLIPDYAFRILGVFDALEKKDVLPLQGLVCSIHDLVTSAAREGNGHIRLPEAHRQLIHLQNLLSEIHHNMGVHLENVLTKETSAAVLQQFLSGYREDIVDKAYHQLRTTDHISKFRPAIYSAFEILMETGKLSASALAWSHAEKAPDSAPYLHRITALLMDMTDRLENLDTRLEGLDARHSQFVDAAVRMVEKHVLADSTTSGHAHRVLETLLATHDSLDAEDTQTAEWHTLSRLHELLNIFEMSFVDSLSQATPRKAAQKFTAKETRQKAPLKKDLAAARARNIDRMMKAMSPERVSEYAKKLLALKDPLLASEIPLAGPQELPFLIYLRIYGNGRHGFFARTKKPTEWIRVHNVGFREFTLSSR